MGHNIEQSCHTLQQINNLLYETLKYYEQLTSISDNDESSVEEIDREVFENDEKDRLSFSFGTQNTQQNPLPSHAAWVQGSTKQNEEPPNLPGLLSKPVRELMDCSNTNIT